MIDGREMHATDEARNCGEINRELLLRPEAGVVLGRAVRRCRPTARFVRFPRPEAADPDRRTYRRASPRETKSGAPIVVANLVPTHDRGPGPPGGRSTWLLLSPNLSSATAIPGVIPFDGERSRDPPSRRDHNATIAIMCAPLHEVTAPGAKRPCRAQPYRLEPRTRSCHGIMAGLPSRCTLALRQKRRTGAALGGTDLLAVAGRRIRGAS